MEIEDELVLRSKRYDDLNFHVVTKDGNEGKMAEFTLKDVDGQETELSGIVSKNNIVFDKVFEKYD